MYRTTYVQCTVIVTREFRNGGMKIYWENNIKLTIVISA